MLIQINGESHTTTATSIAQLVHSLGMKADRVAVELNREIAPRKQWEEIPLRDGDKLEIVQFVGGGGN